MSKSISGVLTVMLFVLSTSACDVQEELEEKLQIEATMGEQSTPMSKAELSKTELESWLKGRYGDIQESQSLWKLTETGGKGPFTYRLRDGRVIQIDGYSNRDLEYFVDPAFDFSTLPTP